VKTASSGVVDDLRIGAYAGAAWQTGYVDYDPNAVGSSWVYKDVAVVYYDHDGVADFAIRAEKTTAQACDWRVDYLALLPIYSTAHRNFPRDVALQGLERVEQQLITAPKGYYDG
jgi:hypothetical protein